MRAVGTHAEHESGAHGGGSSDWGYGIRLLDRNGRELHVLCSTWQDKDRWLKKLAVARSAPS